jgi:ribose 1,5-bisphosphokinase PhnN
MKESLQDYLALPGIAVGRAASPMGPKHRVVAVIGSSCTGKTTLVNSLRRSLVASPDDRIAVPRRFITRRPRGNDSEIENTYVSYDDLASLHARGEVIVMWRRHLTRDRSEWYGFERMDAELLVLSGNNALVMDEAMVLPPDFVESALVFGVYAPDAIRRLRFLRRNPEMFEHSLEEVEYRLGDSSEGVASKAHVVVHNHGRFEKDAPDSFCRLIRFLAESLSVGGSTRGQEERGENHD